MRRALNGFSSTGVDAVSGAGHGGDDPGFAEAFAQPRDGDAHGVGERVCVLIPRLLQELLGADDTAFGGDEDLEHGELLPGQRDVAAVAVDLSAERIQPQTCDLPHGRPVVGAPAVERSEAEHELLELERLREVVVGAELEPCGLVVEAVGSGQDEDRHAAAGGDDASRDLVAGGPGDVPVEDGDVVGVDAQQLQSGVAVTGDVGRDRFQAQAIADGFCHVGLVLDDQHTHALNAPSRSISAAYRKPDTARQHRAALNGGVPYSRPARPTSRRIRTRRLVAGLLVVIAAIAGALAYRLPASSSSTDAPPIDASAVSARVRLARCQALRPAEAVRAAVRLARPAVPSPTA